MSGCFFLKHGVEPCSLHAAWGLRIWRIQMEVTMTRSDHMYLNACTVNTFFSEKSTEKKRKGGNM